MEEEQYSIVQYTLDHSGYRCGYCKSADTNYSHGMHAYSLSVSQYQALIDRGWRRSGSYCYKPTMHHTCCPAYTIRCHAPSIKLTKSQKKVLKRMNNFLAYGTAKERSQESTERPDDGSGGSESFPEVAVRHHERLEREGRDKRPHLQQMLPLQDDQSRSQPPVTSLTTTTCSSSCSSNQPTSSCPAPPYPQTCSSPPAASNKKLKTVVPGVGADPTKPACRKARLRRFEQRQMKLLRLQQLQPGQVLCPHTK
ncbi:Arginine-tRNA-protein transferase N-terminal, partial [Trinorchestia longiramus]